MSVFERFTRPPARRALLALAAVALAGCAPGLPEPAGTPAPDPEAVAVRLREATTPASPRRITFDWTLDEAGARLRGKGVIRMEAPERLRLDLFGPRGESYLAAALVEEEVRVPPAVAERFALPSPALLWGALGVVNPPAGARLVGATVDGEAATLRYETPAGEVLEYRAEGALLRTVRRVGESGALESIALTHSPEGVLKKAEYRDWGAYRTLVLTPESIENVAAFPESTWVPPGTAR